MTITWGDPGRRAARPIQSASVSSNSRSRYGVGLAICSKNSGFARTTDFGLLNRPLYLKRSAFLTSGFSCLPTRTTILSISRAM